MPAPATQITLRAYVALSEFKIKEIGEQPDLGPASILDRLPRSFLIVQKYTRPDHTVFRVEFDLRGKDFTYQNKIPDGGIVKAINVSFGLAGQEPELAYKISGLDLRADKAAALYFADPFEAFATLLTGDDTLVGSPEDDDLFGFAGRDFLRGRGGNDKLHGGRDNDILDGGMGKDLLDGQGGLDSYRSGFRPLGLTNFDTIKLFEPGEKIELSHRVFGEAGKKLTQDEFVDGPAAVDGDDRLIWDNAQRIAYWDPDGNGATNQTAIFKVGGSVHLKLNDFELFDF